MYGMFFILLLLHNRVVCQQQKCTLDIALALDGSVSIWHKYFENEKEFAQKFFEVINPGPTTSHIALMTFSKSIEIVWNFKEPASTDKDLAVKLTKEMRKLDESLTCTNDLLKKAREEVFVKGRARSDVAKVLLLVTDGNSNCVYTSEVIKEAQRLKDEDVEIITIAVGENIEEDELKKIASKPQNFFHLSNFEQLIASVSVLSDKACQMQKNPPPEPVISVQVIPPDDIKETTINEAINFGILIEHSSLIRQSDFEVIKTIPNIVMGMLQTGKMGSQISVMAFAESTASVVKFGETASYDASAMKEKVIQITQSTSSKSCSEVAFQRATSEMFGKVTQQKTKILLLVISNPNNCGGVEKLWVAVQRLKMTGVVVFTLYFGDRIDNYELVMITSGGYNIFRVESLSRIEIHIRTIIERSILYCKSFGMKTLSMYEASTREFSSVTQSIDLVILYEDSQSISMSQFEAVKTMILSLFKVSGISSQGSRVSLVSFSQSAKIHWDLNSPTASNLDGALGILSGLKKSTDSQVCVEKGLEAVQDSIFTEESKRDKVPRFLTFIGLHASNCAGIDAIRSLTVKLKERNIYTFSIGYQNSVSINELSIIASKVEYYWELYTINQIFVSINFLVTAYMESSKTVIQIANQAQALGARNPSSRPAEPNSVDLGIILTDTDMISVKEFGKYVNLIVATLSDMKMGEHASRVSILINGNKRELLWNFFAKEATSVEYAKMKLESYKSSHKTSFFKKKKIETCIDDAVERASYEIFNTEYQRSGVYRVLITITTESQLCSGMAVLRENINKLKNSGIYLAVVAIGRTVDENILKVATSGTNFYFYYEKMTIRIIRLRNLIKYIQQSQIGLEIEEFRETTSSPINIPPEIPDQGFKSTCNIYLGLALDDSASVSSEDYDTIKEFSGKLIEKVSPQKNQAHTALMLFATSGRIIYNFQDKEGYSLKDAKAKLDVLEQSKAPTTCFGNSLHQVKTAMFTKENVREGIPKVLFLMSDGGESCGASDVYSYFQVSEDLKNQGVTIFTIGVGSGIDATSLKQIATSKTETYFPIADYKSLNSHIDKFVQNFCSGKEYKPTTVGGQSDLSSEHCNARLLFIVDQNFGSTEDFTGVIKRVDEMIKYFMSRYNHDERKITSKTAILFYDKKPYLFYDFTASEASSYNLASTKLREVERKSGIFKKLFKLSKPCLGEALKFAYEKVFNTPSEVDRTMDVILVLGRASKKCNDAKDVEKYTNSLKEKQIQILALIMTEADENIDLYKSMVTMPNYFHSFKETSELEKLNIHFINIICRIYPTNDGKPAPPQTITTLKMDTTTWKTPTINLIKTTTPTPVDELINTPAPKKIDSCNVNLLIVIDESSMTEEEYASLKAFNEELITSIMSTQNLAEERITSKTAEIVYSSDAKILWNFVAYEATNSGAAITKLQTHQRTKTAESCTEKPLETALKNFYPKTPNNEASHVLLIITPNPNVCGKVTQANEYAKLLKEKQIKIIVITVGYKESLDELRSIASSDKYFIQRAQYSDIMSIKTQTLDLICSVPPVAKAPFTTTTPFPTTPISTTPTFREHSSTPAPSEIRTPTKPNFTPPPNNPFDFTPPPSMIVTQPPPPPVIVTQPAPPPSPIVITQKPGPIYVNIPPRKHKIKVLLKICNGYLVRRIGCLPSQYLEYYNHPLNTPVCSKQSPCPISINQLKNTFCECSKKSRLLGQNSFAITSKGKCFGNHFLHKISKPSILPNEFCRRHDGALCKESDHTCLGGRDTIYVYSNV